jgi:hypothetical protein
VCGIEQYPANTVIRFDSGHVRHFFCSHQHADGWAASPPAETPPLSLLITVEEVIEEEDLPLATALDPEMLPPKRIGRPPGSKNKAKEEQ